MKKVVIELKKFKVNALIVTPENPIPQWGAVFTHGYTSHKGDQLTWALKIAELGIESILFDLPGHYLGSFNEVESLEVFKENAPKLFYEAYKKLSNPCQNIILGGHSLGAMLTLLAANDPQFKGINKYLVAVGLGINRKANSIASPFIDTFIDSRKGLISPALYPEKVFPWIKETKQNINLPPLPVLLITGENDYVVGPNGTETLQEILEKQGSQVSLIKPKKLPHDQPSLASTHIKHYFRGILSKS